MTCIKNHFPTVLVVVSSLVLLCSGCRRETAADRAGAARHRPTPEESFEEIAGQFARSIQTGAGGVDGGFLVRDEDGHSRLAIRNEVTHELIPPSEEGEPYRGVITVTSERDYAIQRVTGNDTSEDKPSERDEDAQRGQSTDDQGVDIFDEDLVNAPTANRHAGAEKPGDLVTRLSDEDVKQYELQYENNRWVLKTQLDPDTESSIENAFNHILSVQP